MPDAARDLRSWLKTSEPQPVDDPSAPQPDPPPEKPAGEKRK